MFNVRKVAEVEIAWVGPTAIVAKFAISIAGCVVFGALCLRAGGWSAIVGVWLLAIAANYVPLLIHAVALFRAGQTADRAWLQRSTPRIRSYRAAEAIVLVPLAAILLDLAQRRSSRNA